MSVTIDPDLMKDLTNLGVGDATTCFNCGNCTAVCSLSSQSTPFPRKVIRYVQLGLKDKLLQSPEPWLCYYCGECSKTCPREANPGEVMMGLRRYLTSRYEPTGIARLFYRNNVFAVCVTIFLALVLSAFLLLVKGGQTGAEYRVTRWLFGLVDYHFIEYLGVAVFVIVAVSMVGGVVNILRYLSRSGGNAQDLAPDANAEDKRSRGRLLAAIRQVIQEIATLKRYRTCSEEDEALSWYLKPWFVHGAMMWGFVGLALATVLDIPLLGLKNPDAATWLPSRVLGIVSGLLLLYGASIALIRRITKTEANAAHSRFSDWLFLILLWALGLTGFWLTASVYFSQANMISQVVLLIHTVMAMEFLLLFAFSKFAHVIYRPMALFFYYFREAR